MNGCKWGIILRGRGGVFLGGGGGGGAFFGGGGGGVHSLIMPKPYIFFLKNIIIF